MKYPVFWNLVDENGTVFSDLIWKDAEEVLYWAEMTMPGTYRLQSSMKTGYTYRTLPCPDMELELIRLRKQVKRYERQ